MAFLSSKKDDKKKEEFHVNSHAHSSHAEDRGVMSYIGRTMHIEADISSDDDVTIEGIVIGNISVGKTLIIGKSGSVKADINAGVVRIFGEAKGNIIASEKVEILTAGRYSGNIQSQKLVVAEGAYLNGEINQKIEKNPDKPTENKEEKALAPNVEKIQEPNPDKPTEKHNDKKDNKGHSKHR